MPKYVGYKNTGRSAGVKNTTPKKGGQMTKVGNTTPRAKKSAG